MNPEQITDIAFRIILDHLHSGPRLSKIVEYVENYNGDGAGLEEAVLIAESVDDMLADLVRGLKEGFLE